MIIGKKGTKKNLGEIFAESFTVSKDYTHLTSNQCIYLWPMQMGKAFPVGN